MKYHRIAVPTLLLGLFYIAVAVAPRGTVNALSAGTSRELSEKATLAIEEGRWDDAERSLESLLQTYPDNPIYWSQVAKVREAYRQYDKQLEALLKLWDVSPTKGDACPDLRNVYLKAGQLDKALEWSRRCYDLDPLNSDFIFALAQDYERKEDWKKARELYDTGLKLAPEYVDMELGLARLDLFGGNMDAAIRHARQVLQQDATLVDAMLVLGLSYRAQGKLAEARQWLRKVLSSKDTYTDAHLALADIAAKEQNASEARKHYTRVMELDPTGSLGQIASQRLTVLEDAQP